MRRIPGFALFLLMVLSLMVNPLFAAKPLEWIVVKTPHFTVLTAGRAAEAQAWATDLERFRLAMETFLVVDPARLAPVTVVIFSNNGQFKPYKQLQNGKPAAIDGYFARIDNVNAIGLSTAADDKVQIRRIIFHEATHWFSSARREVQPAWMDEGMAEVFSTFTADEKTFSVGDAIAGHVAYLREVGVTNPGVLVGTSRDKINYDDASRTGRFYAGSWALVHWIMFGKKGPGPDSLMRYIELVKTTGPNAAFTTAFGGDYDAVEKKLRAYLWGGQYTRAHRDLPAEPLGIEAPRKATEAEVEYALGALLLGARGPQDGLPRLKRAAALDPANPIYWETVGFAQLRQGDKPEALAAFDRAVEAGSKTGLVWANRAALREESEYSGGVMVSSDPTDFAQAANDFRRAIELDPHCEPAYHGLAGLVYGVEPVDPADEKRLEAGREAFPDDPWIQAGQVALQVRKGTPGAMEKLKQLLAGGALPMQVRQMLENIVEQEKLKVVSEHIESWQKERRYAELIAELDGLLADDGISTQNKQELRRTRNQIDQLRRLNEAVTAINAGRRAEAKALLLKLKEEGAAGGNIRQETERLLQAAE
ncbi:MAG: tetratricopeptide repeat protein [Verrucomicrobia bacterium]|nr:tetratricopeptide repeat protein [Verrucomicrobiota bacterium]